jgi:hypothetical protein
MTPKPSTPIDRLLFAWLIGVLAKVTLFGKKSAPLLIGRFLSFSVA